MIPPRPNAPNLEAPRRLRIALVIEDVSFGGGQERVLAELAPRLAARHEVHLFCHTARDLDADAVSIHHLRALPAPPGVRALGFALTSSHALVPRAFDVVLSQGGNTLGQNFALAHTVHGDRHRDRAAVERRHRVRPFWRRTWEATRDALFMRLERRAALGCRGRVIAVSRSVAEYFVREYGLSPDEVHVAPNGVDHAIFTPALRGEARPRLRSALGLGEDEFVALFMGGLWYEKRLPEVIAALARCEHPIRLVVVGRGEREQFARRAAQAGLATRVSFVPHVDRPQDYYAMADCLVHPYPIEPFGLVVLEAAACGLPLLAARTGVALDLITEGVSGRFITPEPEEIARGLDHLAADPDGARAMGAEAHRRSLAFTWDRQARIIEELFLRLAPKREGAR